MVFAANVNPCLCWFRTTKKRQVSPELLGFTCVASWFLKDTSLKLCLHGFEIMQPAELKMEQGAPGNSKQLQRG